MPLSFSTGQTLDEATYTPAYQPTPQPEQSILGPFMGGYGAVPQAAPQEVAQAVEQAVIEAQPLLAQSYYVPQPTGAGAYDGYGSPQERAAQANIADALIQIRQQRLNPPDYSMEIPLFGKTINVTPLPLALLSGLNTLQYRQVEQGLLGGGMPIYDPTGRIAGTVTEGFFPGTKHYIGRKIEGYTGPYESLIRKQPRKEDEPMDKAPPSCPPGFVYDDNIQACVPMQSAATAGFDVNAPLANRPTYQAGSLLGRTGNGVL